jgi:hypothetical protein
VYVIRFPPFVVVVIVGVVDDDELEDDEEDDDEEEEEEEEVDGADTFDERDADDNDALLLWDNSAIGGFL